MSMPDVAWRFIQRHIHSPIVAMIQPASLQLIHGTFIDGWFHESRTDILYKAKMIVEEKESPVYFLIEHQRKVDPLMPLRMLRYTLSIIEMHLGKNKNDDYPLVYSSVLYNGKRPYSAENKFFKKFKHAELAREIFLNSFQLVDLTQIEDKKLKEDPILGMIEMLLKHIDTQDPVAFIKKIADLLPLVEATNIDLLDAGAYYLFQANKEGASSNEILREFKRHLSPIAQKEIMTIAQAFIEEGRQVGFQTGRQEGRQEGRQDGFRSMLDKQIRRRFPHDVTAQHLHLINDADSKTLVAWGEKLIDAANIDAVFEK